MFIGKIKISIFLHFILKSDYKKLIFFRYEYNSSNAEDNDDSDDFDDDNDGYVDDNQFHRQRQKRRKNKAIQSYSGPPSLAGGGLVQDDPSNLTPKHKIRSPILEETESSLEAELKSQGRLANDRYLPRFISCV